MQTKQPTHQEIEAFKRTASLINQQSHSIPTPEDIQDVIGIIETRLEYKPINRTKNAGVKDGYQKTVEILRNPDKELLSSIKNGDIVDYPFGEMKTIQGRAIASLAYDFLAGKCSKETLCGVPIKE